MRKLDNYLYKKAEKIKSKTLPTLIAISIILINIGSVFIAISLLANLIPKRPFLYFIIYIPLLIFTYFISKCSKFTQFIATNDFRKKILLENKKGESITEWKYTKREWSDFKQKPISSIKKNLLKNYCILLFICLILFITLDLFLSIMLITLIISISVSSITLTDIYSQNWKRILKREEVSIIFSESGIIISKLYFYPSIVKHRVLTNIENDKKNNTIVFEYSIFHPGGSEYNDSIITEKIRLPVFERHKLDINKILKGIKTSIPFKIN